MEGAQGPTAPNRSEPIPDEPLPEGTPKPNGWWRWILTLVVFPLVVLLLGETYKHFLARLDPVPPVDPTNHLSPATGKVEPAVVFSGNVGGNVDGVHLEGAGMRAEANTNLNFKNIEAIGSPK